MYHGTFAGGKIKGGDEKQEPLTAEAAEGREGRREELKRTSLRQRCL
jgi:hypothetical protein